MVDSDDTRPSPSDRRPLDSEGNVASAVHWTNSLLVALTAGDTRNLDVAVSGDRLILTDADSTHPFAVPSKPPAREVVNRLKAMVAMNSAEAGPRSSPMYLRIADRDHDLQVDLVAHDHLVLRRTRG